MSKPAVTYMVLLNLKQLEEIFHAIHTFDLSEEDAVDLTTQCQEYLEDDK